MIHFLIFIYSYGIFRYDAYNNPTSKVLPLGVTHDKNKPPRQTQKNKKNRKDCQRNLEMSGLCNLEMSGFGVERYPQASQAELRTAPSREITDVLSRAFSLWCKISLL